jgi:HAD superfamily hydrolase (TIGR01509 family)
MDKNTATHNSRAASPSGGPIVGVVFDCDGVLANTASCWDEAFRHGARELDLTLDDTRLDELRGAAVTTGARRLAEWSHRPVALAEVIDVVHEQLITAIDRLGLTLIDGALDLLQELHGTVRLGVASNSPRTVLERVLTRLGLRGFFTTLISAHDIKRPKPAPDPYLAACQALGVDPGSSIAVEDSDIGTQSALAAGMTVVHLAPSVSPDAGEPLTGVLSVQSLADHRIRSLVSSLRYGPKA